jgi:monofunctional glycosyltransferase
MEGCGRLLLRGTALFAAALIGLTILLVLPWRWLPPPTTSFMLQERFGREVEVRSEWTALEDMAAALPLAVIASEDQRFAEHRGFDLKAISEAMSEQRARRRGASTISQQVAKNLYLWPGRSYLRKGLEAYLTVAVEALWPKRRILEVYLNVAQFGPGIFGAGAASREFFGKDPSDLTLVEASLLAAVLPSPRRMHPDQPSPYVESRARQIRSEVSRMGGAAALGPLLSGAPPGDEKGSR